MSTYNLIDVIKNRPDLYEWKPEEYVPPSKPVEDSIRRTSVISQLFNNVWSAVTYFTLFPLSFLVAKNPRDISEVVEELHQLELNSPTADSTDEQFSTKFHDPENVNYVVAPTQHKVDARFFKMQYRFLGIPYVVKMPCEKSLTFLNGGLKEIQSERNTEEFNKNMKIAKKIIKYTRQAIPFSANYLARSRIYRNTSDPSRLKNIFETMRITVDKIKETAWRVQGRTVEKLAKVAITRKAGNCLEMAAVGAEYGKTLGASITFCTLANGDHAFLVIGRDKSSKIVDYPNWGENAVACDTWSGACYPANELDKYLLDYDGLETLNNGRIVTLVKPFNPNEDFITGFETRS